MKKIFLLLLFLGLLKVVTSNIKIGHEKEKVVIQQFYLDEQERKAQELSFKYHSFVHHAFSKVSLPSELVYDYRNFKNNKSSKDNKLQTLLQDIISLDSTPSMDVIDAPLGKFPNQLQDIVSEELAYKKLDKLFEILIEEENRKFQTSFISLIDTIHTNKIKDSLLIEMTGIITSSIENDFYYTNSIDTVKVTSNPFYFYQNPKNWKFYKKHKNNEISTLDYK